MVVLEGLPNFQSQESPVCNTVELGIKIIFMYLVNYFHYLHENEKGTLGKEAESDCTALETEFFGKPRSLP